VQDGEPTGAATDTSDAGGNAAAMHWKKAYKTRAATSAGCEDEGKTIVEDNDRSDGALAEVLFSAQGVAVSTCQRPAHLCRAPFVLQNLLCTFMLLFDPKSRFA